MLTPSSLQHPFDLIWSEDPALAAPMRREDETDEQWAATREMWLQRLTVAREYGVWDTLLRPGESPTLFKVRPMPGTLMRRLHDEVRAGTIGPMSASAWALRICLLSVSNMGSSPFKVEMEHDARFGQIASEKVIDQFDAINPGIVLELGMVVNQRAWSPPGK